VYVTTIIDGYHDTPYHRKDWLGQLRWSHTLFVIGWLRKKYFKKNFENSMLWKRAFVKFIIIKRSTQF